MRISDWSSDVCSSDLLRDARIDEADIANGRRDHFAALINGRRAVGILRPPLDRELFLLLRHRKRQHTPHRLFCRRRIPPFPRSRSEEHTSELQSLMRISYAVFCLKKKITT